jgi:cytochrome d ubiquinol oxidase subunit I
MLLASGLTAAFLVAGVSAYRYLRGDRAPGVMAALRTGAVLGAVLIPLQIVAGDLHGLNTLEHQPAKIAAMEGHWETKRGAPLVLFAIPNEAERRNDFEVAIPNLGSFILTHDWYGEVKGLNDFEVHSPVRPVFFAFRVMVGMGFLMLAVSWLASFQLWRRGSLHPHVARVLVAMTFAGWIATLAGWYVTEIGRQPWLVTGVLTTAQAASQTVGAGMVASTLVGYLAIYAALLVAYIATIFFLARRSGAAKDHATAEPVRDGGATAAGAGVAATA